MEPIVLNALAQRFSPFHGGKICFRNSLTWCFHKKKIFEKGQGSAVVCEPRLTDLTFSFLLVLPRVEEIN